MALAPPRIAASGWGALARHSLEAQRADNCAGQAIYSFFYASAQVRQIVPEFIKLRLVDFLLESRWPEPYDIEFDTQSDTRANALLKAEGMEPHGLWCTPCRTGG